MNTFKTVILALIFCSICSFKTEQLTPLSFLKDKHELILQKSKFPNIYIDTLNAIRIKDLIMLQFESKNFEVENYGVTPDYSISVFDKEIRICLISVWNIEDEKLAININHFEKDRFYYGFVIDKDKFESFFKFIKKG
jgi:hypothetical protein